MAGSVVDVLKRVVMQTDYYSYCRAIHLELDGGSGMLCIVVVSCRRVLLMLDM